MEPVAPAAPGVALERLVLDSAALEALGAERVDWRFKGLPPALSGRTVRELAAARLDLFTGGFTTPLLTLNAAALEQNLDVLAAYCARYGLAFAPHGKTTMAPQLFARQFDRGAWALTAATIAQVRVYRAFGVPRVFLANELVDPAAVAWVAGELAADPEFTFCCYVDSVAGARLMGQALAECPEGRCLDVLVEWGSPGARAGCRTVEQAVAVAAEVSRQPGLRLVGVAGYEGVVASGVGPAALDRVADWLRDLVDLATALDGQGRFADAERIVVSAGGSDYFDQVAAAISGPWELSRPVLPVLRSGSYVTHDDGHYARTSPLTRPAAAGPQLVPALLLWGRVLSIPEPGLALLDFGKRDAPLDLGLPVPRVLRPLEGKAFDAVDIAGFEIVRMNDQHAHLRIPTDQAARSVEVGDWVGCGISHPCTAFDRWKLIPLVTDEGTVIDYVRTFF